jgi:hypothetical protein
LKNAALSNPADDAKVHMTARSAVRLAISLALCFAVAYAGARITYREIATWYTGLSKSWRIPA